MALNSIKSKSTGAGFKVGAVSKIKQSNVKANITPTPAGPPSPAERCRRESFVAPDLELGDPLQVKTEQACIKNAKQFAFFGFVISALGIAAKLQNSPSLKPKSKKPQQKYTDDILSVERPRVVQLEFVPEANRGISVFRPEILSVVNFRPIYSGDPKEGYFSKEGKMIEVQHQASKIRAQSIMYLHESIRNRSAESTNEAQKVFTDAQNNFQKSITDTKNVVDLFRISVDKIDEISTFFNLKRLTEVKKTQLGLKSLKDFYVDYMGFTEKQFESFSNTKVFVQFLSDFRQVMENYSFNLLDIVDSDRVNDKSPVNIDTDITLTDGFSFTSGLIRSEVAPINATERKNTQKFFRSLPKEASDRIKILVNFLSKEYRISSILGRPNAVKEKLQTDWNSGDQGSPFDNIVGKAGKTIFDSPVGINSLISLAYENVNLPNQPQAQQGEFAVLPFEDKYIDTEKKTFIPGSSFYLDRIFDVVSTRPINNLDVKFNLGPLAEYTDRFSSREEKAFNIIKLMFHLDDNGKPLSLGLQPEDIFDRVAGSFQKATDGINKGSTNKTKESLQSFSIALMKLANTDLNLKNLLFQYLLLIGLLSNVDNNPDSVWADLALELKSLSAFSIVRLSKFYQPSTDLREGPKVISPIINQIAKTIENEVKNIISKKLKAGSKSRKKPSEARKIASNFLESTAQNASSKGEVSISSVSNNYIKNALLQIANEIVFEKDSNIFREYVDAVAQITNLAAKISASTGSNRNFLLPDGSGRTRFNFVSTSHQTLVIYEIFCALADKFAFCDFKYKNGSILIETNNGLTEFVSLNIKDLAGSRFAFQSTTLGGFSKALKSQLGTDDPSVFVEEIVREHELDVSSKTANQPRIVSKISKPERSKTPKNRTERIVKNNLGLIRTKLIKENQIIVNFLFILNQINQDLKQAKISALSTFNQYMLQLFNASTDIEDIRIVKDPGQVKLAAYMSDEIEFKSRNANITTRAQLAKDGLYKNPIIPKTIPDETKEALYVYLKEPEFQKSEHAETLMKIFSVGIPAEFVRNNVDRISSKNISPNSFKQKEADVLTVNIHKRDLRRPEIIFKPQKFIFDMSLFQRDEEIINFVKPTIQQNHNDVFEKDLIADFANVKNVERYIPLNWSFAQNSIFNKSKYDFLADNEKTQMVKNHYQSYLLEKYITLSSGMEINEKIYLIDPTQISEQMDPGFERLLLSYVKDVLGENIPDGQTIQELLDNPGVNQNVKDLLRSVSSGNLMVSPETIKKRVLKPKKFDRVFHVPVNLDNFEIDIAQMRKTNTGRKALGKASVQNLFRDQEQYLNTVDNTKPVFLKKRTKNDIIFEDYFVTLETVND